ncbi:importin subunit alpha-4-like [Hevea brasiliensis]|uniref:importin subunit alpha-4-like n=1 Tax=Hevea brasiliensis TaxID=3981 RepID=UPI0025DF161A|nr:importin subunit alpha-4-like [Hevea brasiliensis]
MAPKEARRMKRKNQPERHSLEDLEKIRKLERDTILYFKRYDTIINIFCLLTAENPPFHEVIERGCVPRLVEFLGEQHVSHPNLRLGAARALSQIIYCGTLEHAKVVVEDGAVPKFVELLTSENDDLQELVNNFILFLSTSLLALGSVATKSIGCRDLVLGHGSLTQLQYLLEKYSEPPMLRSSTLMLQNASRTLAILCNGSPPPTFEQVKSALPTLQKLIHLHPPVGVLGDVCRDACLASLVCQLVQSNKFSCPELQVVEPVVRIVGNIFRGSDSQIECILYRS